MKNNLLSDLNPQQLKAVQTINGPVLIVAGPGSGKTRVITKRIAFLVDSAGRSPGNIAAVTFTNKAAKEMQSRLQELMGPSSHLVTIATFHSFCSSILRRYGGHVGIDNNFVIYDDDDQIRAIKKCMDETGVDPKNFSPRAILSSISNSKSELRDHQSFSSGKSNYFDEIVSRVFERYEEMLFQNGAVDFDDLLLKTHLLFDKNQEIAQIYQQKFEHLMVDEFQDTNVAQYAIAKKISESSRNLCVVGDPDQSIYSWRNADIRNILSFQTDFPEAITVALEENYRSTQNILNAAQSVIEKNKERVDKNLWTRNKQGGLIVIKENYNDEEEAQSVVKEIEKLSQSPGRSLSDIAVMYRVNAQSRALEMSCQRNGIPYQIVGGVKFYQRKEIKDITSYLRIINNPHDDVSLARIINVPTRSIGQRTSSEISRIASLNKVSMFTVIENICDENGKNELFSVQLSSRAINSLKRFMSLISILRKEIDQMNLASIVDNVLASTSYREYLSKDEKAEERLENLQEYRSATSEFDDLLGQEGITTFLESISLVSDIDGLEDLDQSVTLITLHQAKGLEFPIVFMVGMEEGMLPHIRSIESGDPGELEEERRLCYVGMTRAKQNLFLHRAFRRGFRGGSEPTLPSRFLSDIPTELTNVMGLGSLNTSNENRLINKPTLNKQNSDENLYTQNRNSTRSNSPGSHKKRIVNKINPPAQKKDPIYSTGTKVSHAKFGDGIIMSVDQSGSDTSLTIAFKNEYGIKKLLSSMAKLKTL